MRNRGERPVDTYHGAFMSYIRTYLLSLAALIALTTGCLEPVTVNPVQDCAPGETFKSSDGCNDCICPDSGLQGEAVCTLKECVYDACLDKECGESCTICDPNEPNCIQPAVISACNSQGQCVAETPGMCEAPYEPCDGKMCGELCSPCDPSDALCVAPAVITACSAQGECVASSPDLCEADLCEGVTCPATKPYCSGNAVIGGSGEGTCNPKNGECEYPLDMGAIDCAGNGMVCVDGQCQEPTSECGPGNTPCEMGTCNVKGCGEEAVGQCVPLIDGCDDIYEPVCGCDGVTYTNDCERVYFYGVALKHVGECSTSETCDAMKAQPEGPCDLELGILWNGEQCVSISGCNCTGPDCDALYNTFEVCEKAHSECKAYDPCAGKECGDPCSTCDPKDEDCPKTAEYTVCNMKGQCVPEPEAICPIDNSIELKTCGGGVMVNSDPFTFQDVGFDGDKLIAIVSYSGGCEDHVFTACVSPFDVADPGLVGIVITHEANNDMCEAVITETLTIDLEPLKKEWIAQTGQEHADIPIYIVNLDEAVIFSF